MADNCIDGNNRAKQQCAWRADTAPVSMLTAACQISRPIKIIISSIRLHDQLSRAVLGVIIIYRTCVLCAVSTPLAAMLLSGHRSSIGSLCKSTPLLSNRVPNHPSLRPLTVKLFSRLLVLSNPMLGGGTQWCSPVDQRTLSQLNEMSHFN